MRAQITVAICTHNGAVRIPIALSGLRRQRSEGVQFEIVVIDNASNDTLESVLASWKTEFPDIRHIREPKLGLSHARKAAIAACETSLLVFVDDDNELESGYLERALRHFAEDSKLGALGGRSVARFSGPLPDWFADYSGSYAVGSQLPSSGKVPASRGYLWGAGLVLRVSVVRRLYEAGFDSLLCDRKGKSLASGGDAELCRVLVMLGHSLYYDEDMVFHHHMFPERLTWSYLEKLYRAHGTTMVWMAVYDAAEREIPVGRYLGRRGIWLRWLSDAVGHWWQSRTQWSRAGRPGPPSFERLWLLSQWGRIITILGARNSIDAAIEGVRNAAWRIAPPSPSEAPDLVHSDSIGADVPYVERPSVARD